MAYFKNINQMKEEVERRKNMTEEERKAAVMERVARDEIRIFKDKIIASVNGEHTSYSRFPETVVDGIRYVYVDVGPKAETVVAVVDCSSPMRIVIPNLVYIDGAEYSVMMVYVRNNTQKGTVIDISDNDYEIRFEGSGTNVILRANKLEKDITSNLPWGLTKFNNLIVKAPDLCARDKTDDIIYLTDMKTDKIIEVPIAEIEGIAEKEVEVYSGFINTSIISLKEDSRNVFEGGLIFVYEDRDTIFSKLNN